MKSHTSNVDPVLGGKLSDQQSWIDEVAFSTNVESWPEGSRYYDPFWIMHSDRFLISLDAKLRFNENNLLTISPNFHDLKTMWRESDFILDEAKKFNLNIPEKRDPLNGYYGDEEFTGLKLVYQNTSLKNLDLAIGNHQIAVGLQGVRYKQNIVEWGWETFSFFAEDMIVAGHFSILVGARYDKTYFDDQIRWPDGGLTITGENLKLINANLSVPGDINSLVKRVAFAYQITDNQTVKLSFQEGFRFPDAWFQEINEVSNVINKFTNPTAESYLSIGPEKSTSYEASYHGNFNNRYILTTTLFYNTYEDLQGYVTNIGAFGNSDKKFKSFGGEISFNAYPFKGLELGASYSYARPIDSYEREIIMANKDDTWVRYPVHSIKFRFDYEIIKNLHFSTLSLYESPRYDKDTVTDPKVKKLFDVHMFVMDANLYYNIQKNLTVSLTAKEFVTYNFNQYTNFFAGKYPLDAPNPENPQFYLTVGYKL